MSQTRGTYPRFIVMRIPDGVLECGYVTIRALLVNSVTAISIKNGEFEVCRVEETENPDIYDHAFSNYPTIYVGTDEEFAFYDILCMSVSEFFGKYPCYGESVKSAELYHKKE